MQSLQSPTLATQIMTGEHNPDDFNLEMYEDALSGKVYVKNPGTGQPTHMYMEFAGPEHPERKKRSMNRQRAMRAHLQKTGKLNLKDPLEDEEDNLDLLVSCALSWNLPYEFTPAKVMAVLSDSKRRWFRDQMQAGFDERENFIVRSASV